jgi:hypothetical protein
MYLAHRDRDPSRNRRAERGVRVRGQEPLARLELFEPPDRISQSIGAAHPKVLVFPFAANSPTTVSMPMPSRAPERITAPRNSPAMPGSSETMRSSRRDPLPASPGSRDTVWGTADRTQEPPRRGAIPPARESQSRRPAQSSPAQPGGKASYLLYTLRVCSAKSAIERRNAIGSNTSTAFPWASSRPRACAKVPKVREISRNSSSASFSCTWSM